MGILEINSINSSIKSVGAWPGNFLATQVTFLTRVISGTTNANQVIHVVNVCRNRLQISILGAYCCLNRLFTNTGRKMWVVFKRLL